MDNERNEAVQAQPEQTAEVRSEAAQRPAQRPFNRRRKKVCTFCADKIEHIDYKDINRLKKCVSDRAKILPRRISGACAKHQRQITIAIKRARHVALMPYIGE
jgi:small subunit ribosomal protein S18